jgi:rod shape-determining protein MreD
MRLAISRDGIEVHRFNWIATLGVPVLALLVQASLPLRINFFSLFDLPLLVTVFFSVARRNKVMGTVTGALIGIAQDALTQLPIGLFGISKTIIGYAASSIGAKVDVENPGSRLLMVFGFYLIHRGIYQLLATQLARLSLTFSWSAELGAALANALLAVILFALLDRTKLRK